MSETPCFTVCSAVRPLNLGGEFLTIDSSPFSAPLFPMSPYEQENSIPGDVPSATPSVLSEVASKHHLSSSPQGWMPPDLKWALALGSRGPGKLTEEKGKFPKSA